MKSADACRAPRAVLRRGGALLFLLALAASSCREADTAGAGPGSPAVDVRLSVGTRFVFNAWQLDLFGQRIPGSVEERRWLVAATGISAHGFDDVTIVLDSTDTTVDTLFFRIPVAGDVHRFGFLADVFSRRGEPDIPARWDRLTAFSAGLTGEWVMGTIDSAGAGRATARSTGDEVVFTVTVEGVPSVLPGYRVTYTAGNVDGSMWVGVNGFFQFRDERFLAPRDINGDLLELTRIDRP